jgi:ribosomal-protein-alanine N-acetyltransferase
VPAVPRAQYTCRIELSGTDDSGFLLFDPMHVRDIDAVFAIERQSFPTPFTPEAYRQELADRDSFWWVVRWIGRPGQEGRPAVVAYVGYFEYGDGGAHVSKIATDPTWRRRRLGEWLLLNMLIAAHRQGTAYVTLEVRESNAAARQFYRKWGFIQLERSRSHYEDTGEDGLILAYPALAEPDIEARLAWQLHLIAIQAP